MLRALACLFRDACFHCIPSSVVSKKLAQLKSCVMCPEVFFSCSPPFQNRRRLSLSAQHSSFWCQSCQAVGMPEFLLAKKWVLLCPLLPCTVIKERFIAHIPLASATAVDCTAALYQGWIQRLGVHHQRQGTAVQILFVGKPLFSPLHLTQLHYCLPSIL